MVSGTFQARRQHITAWIVCCVLAGAVFVVYALTARGVGGGEYVLPLDDVYIHFQYAHQLAAGKLYVYNDNLPPTSGATSLLYPYVLAAGVLLGFTELNLGVWALGVGFVALAAAGFVVYRLVRLYAWHAFALVTAGVFIVNGAVSWHFMSGMETGLVTLALLATLYAFVTARLGAFVAAAVALALLRPEGGVWAVLAVAAWVARAWWARRAGYSPPLQADAAEVDAARGERRGAAGGAALVAPLLAPGVQPLVNGLVTGSAVATGNAAKSLFGVVPFYPDYVIGRVVANTARMWYEFVLPDVTQPVSIGVWGVGLVAVVTLLGMIGRGVRRATRARAEDDAAWMTALLVVAWLLAGTVAISTLDTAFWHFKRYQMPLIALLYPVAGWGAAALYQRVAGRSVSNRFAAPAFLLLALSFALGLYTSYAYWARYRLNVGYVVAQPLQMARWLAANAPADAVVAVHDTGMMRYQGGRTTVDIVGLTTPGAAEYWRNGPGAVAEFIDRTRPTLIASYGRGHGFGLGYLAATSLYAETLAEYPVALDPVGNVALAADVQGIYRPAWNAADTGAVGSLQPSVWQYIDGGAQAAAVFALDTADLASERAAAYTWQNTARLGGFPTEVFEFDYLQCETRCRVLDGGRRINGDETFRFSPPENRDFVLVTRVHPANAGTLDVYVNAQWVDRRIIPTLPGAWLEVATRLPADLLGETNMIRIVATTPDGFYQPYHHWIYAAAPVRMPDTPPLATWQNGGVRLHTAALTVDAAGLNVGLDWATDGSAEGDAKIFVHVLDTAGATVAQADVRPGGNTLPPGNWLAGTIDETIRVDLSALSAGRYHVVMGLYDPVTFERFAPSDGDDASRVALGSIVVP